MEEPAESGYTNIIRQLIKPFSIENVPSFACLSLKCQLEFPMTGVSLRFLPQGHPAWISTPHGHLGPSANIFLSSDYGTESQVTSHLPAPAKET